MAPSGKRDIQSTSISTDEIERILVDAFIKKTKNFLNAVILFRLSYTEYCSQSTNQRLIVNRRHDTHASFATHGSERAHGPVFNGCSDESPRLNELLLRYDMMENVELDRSEESKEWQRKNHGS